MVVLSRKPKPMYRLTWVLLVSSVGGVAQSQTCGIEIVSVSSSGQQANGYSFSSALSWDAMVVAFDSEANNLVAGDSNGKVDVFVRDRSAGSTSRISVTSSGAEANGGSAVPGVSGDGRFVSFRSIATNLDPLDLDPGPDIYLHDRVTGKTELVSERTSPGSTSEGALHSVLSVDGRYVAFDGVDDNFAPGDNNHWPDVFLRDMQTGTVEIISVGNQGEQGNEASLEPAISSDGRYVAFTSSTSNWFPGNDKKVYNVYVRDRLLQTTKLVTHTPSGGYAAWGGGATPSMSADGEEIAFMFLGQEVMPWLGDLRKGYWQAYTYSIATGSPQLVSKTYFGTLPHSYSYFPKVSGNGRFVALESYATNLVPHPGDGNQDVFLRDVLTGVTIQLSRGLNGAAPDAYSISPVINFDGAAVAFASKASNLVPGDLGGQVDIFVYECDVASPTVYCEGKLGASGCKPRLSFQGTPSASAGSGFDICGEDLIAGEPALLMYSLRGSEAQHYLGGLLCVQPPLHRTPPILAGGTSLTCDGAFTLDMNAWIASGGDARLIAGASVYAQLWARDPLDPAGAVLSDAVAFVIEP